MLRIRTVKCEIRNFATNNFTALCDSYSLSLKRKWLESFLWTVLLCLQHQLRRKHSRILKGQSFQIIYQLNETNLVLRAGCGIWLYQFLIIAYLFTLQTVRVKELNMFFIISIPSLDYFSRHGYLLVYQTFGHKRLLMNVKTPLIWKPYSPNFNH